MRNENEMKRPSMVNTRDIRPSEKSRWVQIKVGRKCERGEISTFSEGQKLRDRSEIQEPEVGEEEVKWWAEWRKCEGRLFHKTGAEWKKDLLEIFRPEMTEERLSVVRDEEQVERWGVSEWRERK